MPQYVINSESDILNPAIRAEIIKEINEPENRRRKAEAFKRYEILKDRTDLYVLEMLLKQFDQSTVQQMQYALSNVSFARKAVDKLARVYNYGVTRSIGKKKRDTEKLQELAKELEFDRKMKKANRYVKAFKNCMVYPKPVKEVINGTESYGISLQVLSPYLYDVIADPNDRERPMCVILSDYSPESSKLYSFDAATEGRTINSGGISTRLVRGDSTTDLLADQPGETVIDEHKEYVWWTRNHHFTTNAKGAIIGKSATAEPNPIAELPFVNLAVDQDGEFWSIGGSDLMDGAIRVNAVLTHVIHIGIVQGYGQLVLKGKNIPKSVKVGPNSAITLEYSTDAGDPAPDAQFITANPPLADLMDLVSQYVALLLTTNNLSTSGVSTELNSPAQFASGIAMMIDRAESNEDVMDQQQIFLDAEPKIWEIVQKWMKLYKEKGVLSEDLSEYQLPETMDDLVIKLGQPQPVLSEMEQLDIIAKRKELGINTMAELLMKDNPDLTEEEAEEKLLEIEEEMTRRAQAMVDEAVANGETPPGEDDGEDPEKSGDKGKPDEGNGKPGKRKPDDRNA
jgi:hypothetical protein